MTTDGNIKQINRTTDTHTRHIHRSDSLPSAVSPEPPLLIEASECDACIWPDPLPPADWSPRRCRRRRNRLRRNEPELRTPAILLKSVAEDVSVMSHVLRRRAPSSSSLHNHTILSDYY